MPRTHPIPLDVHRLVTAHPGRIAHRSDLHALGCGTTRLAGWVREGQLRTVLPGWFALGGDVTPPLQHVYALLAYLHRLRPDSPVQVGGLSALVIAGLLRPLPARATLHVAHGRRVRAAGLASRVLQRLDGAPTPWDPRRIPIRPPALALADVVEEGAVRTDDELRALVYEVVNQLRVRPRQLLAGWASTPPRRVRRLLALAADGSLEHESPAERRTFLQIMQLFPPAPDCQVQITARRRADYAYLFAALIVEYHGEDAHRDRVDEDAVRTLEFQRLGYEVMVITRSMTRDPEGVAAFVHERRLEREALMLDGRLRRPPLPLQPPRLTPLRTLHPFA